MSIKVQDQSQEVLAMAENWPVAEALLSGTPGMRKAGEKLLPKWPNEDGDSYTQRLATATLFPAFGRTISVMSGKPFAKQITLGDDVPARIRTWTDDADLQGNSLHAFMSDVMTEVLGFGLGGVLVDYPTVGTIRTQAEETALGARPYLVFIQHSQILGWRSERKAGAVRLTQLRLAESVEVNDGEFGTVVKKRVRVLRPGSWEVWEENEKLEYSLIEGGVTTLDQIPFVPFYGKKRGFMTGISPLIDVAYLNVKHWQSQSDQDTIMHVARVPVLAIIGGAEPNADGTGGTKLTVGAASAVNLPRDADMKYVEHTGKAIEAGEESLEKLENQMILTGAELLVIKPGDQKTATQSSNEADANKSDLQRLVENFEDSLDQVLQLMGKWVGEKAGGHASLFKDFGAATLGEASADLIVALQEAGLITRETAIREQQRRGILAADIVPADELEAVKKEPPGPNKLKTELVA
jgi:hypothetical protein